MEETILKIIKLKVDTLRRYTKLTNLYPDLSRKHERRNKSAQLEMKKERLQQTMQK